MARIDELILTFALNALWQIPAAVTAGLLGDLLLRRAPARHRHGLWVAVLAAAVALPSVSLFGPERSSKPVSDPARQAAATPDGGWTAWLPDTGGQPAPVSPTASTLVALLYGLSLTVHGVQLGRAWRRADRLARGAHPLSIPEALAPVVSRCRAALSLPSIEILGSPEVAGPVTVGARRPLILLPSRFFDSASPEELTTALGHEMAHVRRRDYAVHLLCELLFLPVAFHPAAWLVRRRIAETREMACDEAALETLVRPRVYARSLLSLAAASAGLPRPSTTLGVLDAHTLEVRMKRILDHGPRLGTRPARAALGAALLLLAGIAATSTLFSVEAVAASTESLAPFVGNWSGDWPSDEEGGKTMRALDVEVHPDGRIVTTWYRYQMTPDGAANPRKVAHPVTGYTVEGNTLKIDTRVEDFTFGDKPAGTAEIKATLEIEGRDKAVYRSLSNSYLEALKKRGEPVPPPPPPIPLKRQS
jgi:beta-lactamase regulating signal transducer with metallopeptidase domain